MDNSTGEFDNNLDWLRGIDLHIESMPLLYPQINGNELMTVDPFQTAPAFPWLGSTEQPDNDSISPSLGTGMNTSSGLHTAEKSIPVTSSENQSSATGPNAVKVGTNQPIQPGRLMSAIDPFMANTTAQVNGLLPSMGVHNMPLALLTAAAMKHNNGVDTRNGGSNVQGRNMKLPLPSREMSVAIISAQKAQQEPVDPEQAKKDRNSAATARFRRKRREELLDMEQKATEVAQREADLLTKLSALTEEKYHLLGEWDALIASGE
eukprot:CFRG4926T1